MSDIENIQVFDFLSDDQQKPEQEKFYIYNPYELKDDVKKAGALYDPDAKLWYVLSKDEPIYEKYKKVYLINSYKNKDTYAKYKAKYDGKEWYTYHSNEFLKDYFT